MGSVQRKIGDIQPFAELAQGATTVVYKGYQRTLDRFVLLKVLRPDLGYDEERVRRFEAEARLIAQLHHPNVVAIYGSGSDDGQAYIAAEFVDGFDLHDLIEKGALPPELALFILREAARGLRAAHAHGILHRDLKPSNILVAHDGQVKLTDFGMASLLEESGSAEVRGTPGYLAPELIRGEPPTRASDLFSLGATCYEALAGRAAFTGADTGALLDAVLHYDPLPRLERFVELPDDVTRVCARLLDKDPATRYPDTDALIADLDAALAGSGVMVGSELLQTYLEDPDAYLAGRKEQVRMTSEAAHVAVEPRVERPPLSSETTRRRVPWIWGVGLSVLLVVGLGASLLLMGEPPVSVPEGTMTGEPAAFLPEADTSREVVGAGPDAAREEPQAVDAPSPAAQTPASLGVDVIAEADTSAALSPVSVDTIATTPPETLASSPAEDPAPVMGGLSVAVQPWAEVYVDEEHFGQVPPALALDLPAGTHRLVLKHRQLPEYTEEVEIRAGETTALNVSLWDLVGRFSINAQPWAEVLVDRAVRDTTPVHDLIIGPGEHLLTLRNPGLGAWDTTLVVRGGETRTLRVNLTNKRLRR